MMYLYGVDVEATPPPPLFVYILKYSVNFTK